jgi:hypothetical protein
MDSGKNSLSWEKLKTANVLCGVITVLCFAFLFSLLWIEIPENNRDIVNFLSGIMFGTGFCGVVYFLYNFKKSNNSPDSEELSFSECANCNNKDSLNYQTDTT